MGLESILGSTQERDWPLCLDYRLQISRCMVLRVERIRIKADDTVTSREVIDYAQNRSEPPTVVMIDV